MLLILPRQRPLAAINASSTWMLVLKFSMEQ
ncbi:hypothetical protein swp_0115 [Shewanella piezotolerans WP3]|uniref:Uncharacterized protein n=1 Tax=Shewanella piezotolerans (strain WP3 / JCM 13877) TaxID=225849 RepID=B8CGW6_SHEPW|nr:hypothetical protein swp_0115 [Shewanella piezotolerans WP3]